MLRYLGAVKEIKTIIQKYNLTVMCTIARYACAYESIAKPEWWSKTKRSTLSSLVSRSLTHTPSAGPIVEQATHLCDLSRYFGGEVDLASILAHSVEWYEDPGRLSKVPIEENRIEEDDRIPRVTSATWYVVR
jgi:predicted dehydrogenase